MECFIGTVACGKENTKAVSPKPSHESISRIRWQGQIESVQCRAWVWRYKLDNRTHHHLGFNLFIKGEADGQEGRFTVAVSNTQHTKQRFRIGDVFIGTACALHQGQT